MIVTTETRLAPEDQAVARDAIVEATAIDSGAGDTVLFETGPVDPVAPAAQPVPPAAAPARAADLAEPAHPAERAIWSIEWFWTAAALGIAAALAWFAFGRRGSGLGREDHEAFAARLRRQLNLDESGDAAG
jgi:flagellar M-ring protein FliF